MSQMTSERQDVTAPNYKEAVRLLSCCFDRIRLAWNISSDEFFTIAALAEKEEGVKVVKEGAYFYLQRQ